MKLDWMRLSNFRQFYGDQDISFSRDSKRNVTVIEGVNGAGKSALFTALNWCLYGKGAEDMGELVSKRAVTEAPVGGNVGMQVQLGFTHEGERFTATRALSVTKTGDKDWRTQTPVEFSLASILADGQTRRVPNGTGKVESILPSNVRNYFFFDGEQIDQFARPTHEGEVRSAVRNVLKIEVLDRARNHLDSVARGYQNSLKGLSSGGIDELLEKEESLNAEVENTRSRLAALRDEKAAAERQTREVEARLSEIREIQEWTNQRDQANENMKRLRDELEGLWRSIKDDSNLGFYRFAGKAVENSIAVVDAMRERGEIPPGIREQFVHDLLATHICICGRPIEEESEEHRRLMEVLARALPSQLENAVLEVGGQLRSASLKMEEVLQRLRQLMQRKAQINIEQEELTATLDEVSRHLRDDETHEDVAALEKKRVDHQRAMEQVVGNIGRLEERLENQRSQLGGLKESIDKERFSEKTAQDLQSRRSLARKSSDAVDRVLEKFASDMRESIELEANEIFQSLVLKDSQFQEVQLGEDYHIEVIDRWGLPARSELSAGERQVLSLAFITGMSKVTGEEAPLVMDTPFGRLSSDHREAITQRIPEITDQLVILVTDEELHSQARENLAPRIGAEYQLKFDQDTGCTRIVDLADSKSC